MIKLSEKIGYGLGDMSSSMFWKLFSMYLLFFYTDVFGISAAAVGTMFLLTRIWDSLNDPIMGIVADRTNSRWGKFRPYLLWGALPFGMIGVLTFTVPSGFSESGKLIYVYATYTFMMMIYTTVNVPYASLLGVMSDDPKDRTTLSSFRMFFAFLGSFIALLLIEPFIALFSTSDSPMTDPSGWQWGVSMIAILCVLLFLGCFYLTRERVKPIQEGRTHLKDDLKDLIRNSPWWILLGSGISTLIFNSVRDGSAIYYFKYFVCAESIPNCFGDGFAFSITTLYFVIGQVANMIGVAGSAWIANRLGSKRTYVMAMLGATLFSILFYYAEASDLWLILSLQFLISTCAGMIFPLLWAMYADIADYSELTYGRRATGLIFSSSSMSQKFGWTLGGALTGWLLTYFGFEANQEQAGATLTGIKMMMSWIPAGGTLLSILFILFYPLGEGQMRKIVSELTIRRNR